MKKTLIAIALLALTATAASAQTTTAPGAAIKTTGSDANQTARHEELMNQHGKGGNQGHKSPAQKADHHAAKMAKELGLNADQEAKVESLLLAQSQEMTALKAKYAGTTNQQAMHTEAQAVHAKYDTQLKTILGADAYARYDHKRDEHRDENKKGHAMKAGQKKAKAKS